MAVALPIIAVAASVAGTAYSAYSSHQAGERAESAEKKQAAMMSIQATERERVERDKARRMLATQASRVGASGVDLSGSPILNLMQTQEEYEKQLANIKLGYQWQIEDTLAQGEQYKKAGEAKAGSTILSGLGTLTNTAQRYGWFEGS